MVNNFLPSSLHETAKALLATFVMRLPRFRRPAPCDVGARIVLYHEVPAATVRRFRRHLAYFSQTYEVVSLDRLARALHQGHPTDGWLVITFDDGFKDNAEIAAPLLQEFGLTACFFATTRFVSLDPRDQDGYGRFAREGLRRSDSLPAMNWDDLRFLLRQGFLVGSHTRTHPDLATLPLERAVEEIIGSRVDIEEHLGVAPAHFAWPFGRGPHFNEHLRQVVRDAGYTTCCSGERGINSPKTSLYNLTRDLLQPHWSLDMVRFFLEGGYDWVRHLGLLQYRHV